MGLGEIVERNINIRKNRIQIVHIMWSVHTLYFYKNMHRNSSK